MKNAYLVKAIGQFQIREASSSSTFIKKDLRALRETELERIDFTTDIESTVSTSGDVPTDRNSGGTGKKKWASVKLAHQFAKANSSLQPRRVSNTSSVRNFVDRLANIKETDSPVKGSDSPKVIAVDKLETDVNPEEANPEAAELLNSIATKFAKVSKEKEVVAKPSQIALAMKEVEGFFKGIYCLFNHILHPYEPLRVQWDTLVVLLMIYALIDIPFRVSFSLDLSMSHPFELISLGVDMLMLLDCWLNFRTGYMEDDEYVEDLQKIAKHYLSSWFFVDFTTSVPTTYVLLLIPGSTISSSSSLVRAPRLLRILKTLKVLKVLRVVKLMRVMGQWEEQGTNNWAVTLKFMRFVLLIFLMAHISGCFWHACSELTFMEDQEDRPGWVERYEGRTSPPIMRLYLLSVYWAFTTLTTTGYGDVTPGKNIEVIWTIIVMFVGTCTFGYIIANITSLIAHEDEAGILLREKIQSVQAYMDYRELPQEIKEKMQRHYEYVWKRSTVFEEAEILSELPSTLRSEVSRHVHRDIISNVEFLRELDECEVALLVERMKPTIAFPQEIVVEEDHFGREMYFCSNGVLEQVIGQSVELVTLMITRGSYFAEYTLILEIPKHPATVRSLTSSDLLTLSKEDFDFVGSFFPDIYNKVIKLGEQRYEEVMEYKRNNPDVVMRKVAKQTSESGGSFEAQRSGLSSKLGKWGSGAPGNSVAPLPENAELEIDGDPSMGDEQMAKVQLWKHNAKMNIVTKEYQYKMRPVGTMHSPSNPDLPLGEASLETGKLVEPEEFSQMKDSLSSLESRQKRLESRLDSILSIVTDLAANQK